MARYFPDRFIEEVRMRNDLVELVGESVRLNRRGGRLWGLCPFHSEKSPSFSVDGDKQMYYCFGCHAGGSVFNYVMNTEHVDFPEAVTILAERARIPLPEVDAAAAQADAARRDRLLAVSKEAAKFFFANLWTADGAQALEYLHRRGVDDATIRHFGIGCAPMAGWDKLLTHLGEMGYPAEVVAEAGLAVRRDGKQYDSFRARVIFPIFDARGSVIAFGGRILGDGSPKYLNSSDTPIFNKRRNLYGLHFVKKMRDIRELLLVEGYMDVVSLFQHGVKNTVATLGTAITPEQSVLMKRVCPTVAIAYDGDSAGRNAALKAVRVLEEKEVTVRVLDFPGGQDPDEFVRANGAAALNALKGEGGMDYQLTRAKADKDLSTTEGRTAYAKAASVLLNGVRDPVDMANYLKRLSVETGFSIETLAAQIGVSRRSAENRPARAEDRDKAGNVRDTKGEQVRAISRIDLSGAQTAQRWILASLAKYPRVAIAVTLDEFDEPRYRAAAEILLANPGRVDMVLENAPNDADRSELAELFLETLGAESDVLRDLDRWFSQVRIPAIDAALRGALEAYTMTEQAGKPDMELLLQVDKLSKDLERLRSGRRKE